MTRLNVPFVQPPAALWADERQPLVAARIGAVMTSLIVDTGTTETLLTRTLAARLGLALATVAPGVDHALNPVPTWTASTPVSMTLGGLVVRLDHVAVVDMPARLDRLGVGGILCPQRLAPEALLSLDFRRGRLTLTDEQDTDEPEGLVATHFPRMRLAGEEASLVVARSRDFEPSGVMFNSGTWEGEVAPEEDAPLVTTTAGFGLGGGGVAAVPLGARSLALGALRLPLVPWLASPQRDGVGAQIGLQLLAATRLDVSLGRDLLCWWTPASWVCSTPPDL